MSLLNSVLWDFLMFLCAVGPLIILHELGHYWVGRWCGVRAEAFSIGFGPRLAGWTDKCGTRWKLSLLPLGGYVKFAAAYEADGSPSPLQPYDGFETAKLWQRALIIAAGPLANFIIALFILTFLVAQFGEPVLSNRVGALEEHSVAASAGFKIGDQILAINGSRVNDFEQIRAIILARSNQNLHFQIKRNNQQIILSATPKLGQTMDEYHVKSTGGHLGIGPTEEWSRPNWWMLPFVAMKLIGQTIITIATVIGKIFTGQIAASALGGPMKTAQISGQVASYGWAAFLSLIASISINLGFINLLPVPVLDGGHLAMYGLEAIRRKPLPPKAREKAMRAGLAMLLVLFVFVTVNDLGSFGLWDQLADLIGKAV